MANQNISVVNRPPSRLLDESLPRPYVPGSDPYEVGYPYVVPYGDKKYWGDEFDEAAMQYRGQVGGITPEIKQTILNNATSEQAIERLIKSYGLPVVERVLREDIESGRFHSMGDTRSHSEDRATGQALYNRRHGLLSNTDWRR